MAELATTSAVIDALGGTGATVLADRPGRNPQRPTGVRPRDSRPIPYPTMTAALAAKGLFAPAWLWTWSRGPGGSFRRSASAGKSGPQAMTASPPFIP